MPPNCCSRTACAPPSAWARLWHKWLRASVVLMSTPSARNDYRGSSAEWLHHHECPECALVGPVEFIPGYKASACGAIWGSGKTRGRAFRKMRSTAGRSGYLWVQVRKEGRNTKVSIHRVVAEVFLVRSPGAQVRHLDGDPHNNAVSNLRWGTARENAADRDAHGTTARGERNGQARHANEEVALAREMLAGGASQREVAEAFSCSQSTVWRWANGRRRTS